MLHSQPENGGTATYALQAADALGWMLPFENSADEEPRDLSTDEGTWCPLSFEGAEAEPVMNEKLSLAYPPVSSANDTVVTIRLQRYRWSDGAPVTARDAQFSVDLYRAGEADIATYVPGNFPDSITSFDVVSPTELVLHLNRPSSQEWFTDSQLVNLIPRPEAGPGPHERRRESRELRRDARRSEGGLHLPRGPVRASRTSPSSSPPTPPTRSGGWSTVPGS